MVYNGDNDNNTMALIYIYIMVDIYNQWPFQEPIDWRYLPYIRPIF